MHAFKAPQGTIARLAKADADLKLAQLRFQIEVEAAAAALELPGPVAHIDLAQGLLLVQEPEQEPKLKLED